MATTHGVTLVDDPRVQPRRTGQPGTVCVIGLGPFGRAVAREMGRLGTGAVTPLYLDDAAAWTGAVPAPAGAYVLVSARPEPKLTADLDDLAFRCGASWLSVIVEHPHLRVGPVVVPGEGPCGSCFDVRRAQHDPTWPTTEKVHAHYRDNPHSGPAGWQPGLVLAAAAMALAAVDPSEALLGVPGDTAFLNLLTLATTSGRTQGVHTCPRCGPRVDGSRTYRRMLSELEELWTTT